MPGREGTPKPHNLFIKHCVFICMCLNFSHLQSTLHLVNTPIKTFFHCSKQFFNSFTLMPFSASAVLCYTSSTLSGFVFLWGLFNWGNKNVAQGWDRVRWRVGHRGHAIFGQRLLNTQCGVGRPTYKSSILKWANTLKEVLKKIHWSQTQPLTTMPAGTLTQMGS